MKKIKYKYKYIILLVIAVIIIIIFCFRCSKKGYTIKYKISKDKYTFNIIEIYTKNQKKEKDNYYIEIKVRDDIFNYQIYDKFSKKKIVKDIYYYKDDEYECIYPKFIDDYKVDIKCNYNNYYYNYVDLVGKNEKLDEFSSNIDEYNINDFIDRNDEFEEYKGIKLYKNNMLEDYILSLTNLRGISVIKDSVNNINIYDNDLYKRKISGYSDKYYFTAKYTGKHNFREIYVYNLTNYKYKTAKYKDNISVNSYVQGIVDNEVYIYDIDNEKQYKLNLNKNTIEEVKNKNRKIDYYTGNGWTTISIAKANSEYLFGDNLSAEFKDYDIVNKNGNYKSGFYYLLKKKENNYEVYRASIMNKKVIEYLFDVENPNSLVFVNDTVFFIEDNNIYYYNQTKGIRKLIEYDELLFNNSILYHAFINK